MSNVINNTFWAVFFGSTLGTLTVYLTTTIVDEYRHMKRHKDMHLLLDQLEEYEYED
jgi:hypothetical protein